ncbi:MAG: hypothetical protein AAGI37_16210 [Planctomycetota bacterium]
MRSNRTGLIAITLTSILILLTAPASAAPIKTGILTLDFTSGPLAGQQVVGSFTVDESLLTGSGVEQLVPTDASLLIFGGTSKRGFLSLDVTIDGNAFSLDDDFDYPELPVLFYEDGVPVAFDFFMTDPNVLGDSDPFLNVLIDPELIIGAPVGTNELVYRPDGSSFDNESTGTAAFTVVPEPATAMLLLPLGWALARRHHRATVASH